MFCLYCGNTLPDDALFCNACGKQQHFDAAKQADISSSTQTNLTLDNPSTIQGPHPQSNQGQRHFTSTNSPQTSSVTNRPITHLHIIRSKPIWYILGASLVMLGIIIWLVYSSNARTSIQENGTSDTGTTGTTPTVDTSGVNNAVQQFCNATAKGDWQSVYNMLSQAKQEKERLNVYQTTLDLTSGLDTNIDGQHPSGAGGFTTYRYSLVGCTLVSVTPSSTSSGQSDVEAKVNWLFSDNAITRSVINLVYENNNWKIDDWNFNV